MFDLICKRGCRRVGGVRVFGYSIALPDLSAHPRIAAFYEDISALVSERCDSELARLAEDEYLSLCERDRQTAFRPSSYTLVGEVTYFDGEIMIVKLTATVRYPCKEQSRRIFEVHAWSVDDQLLIPPRRVARRFIPKGRLPSMLGDCGFLVENGSYYICKGGSLFPISVTNNKC